MLFSKLAAGRRDSEKPAGKDRGNLGRKDRGALHYWTLDKSAVFVRLYKAGNIKHAIEQLNAALYYPLTTIKGIIRNFQNPSIMT